MFFGLYSFIANIYFWIIGITVLGNYAVLGSIVTLTPLPFLAYIFVIGWDIFIYYMYKSEKK